jgi:PAS domain-containing protein
MSGGDTDSSTAPESPPRPILGRSRPVAIVLVFVGIVICLLGLTVYSARLLSAGHAFVAAEARWAKAQKDAAFHLTRYALDHSEDDYDAFRRAAAVIEGDRIARLELAKPRPDEEIVRRGLAAGGVHAEDVDGLLSLHRLLRGFGPMDYVMTVWLRSDPSVRELNEIARALHDAGGAVPRADGEAFARRIDRINRSLAPLEKDFADTLDEMERTAQSLLATGILVITAILLIAGITLSRRFLAQNEKLQAALAESEAQLRHVIETAPMPLLIARLADQRLLYLNGKALAHLGMELEAAVAHSFSDLHLSLIKILRCRRRG